MWGNFLHLTDKNVCGLLKRFRCTLQINLQFSSLYHPQGAIDFATAKTDGIWHARREVEMQIHLKEKFAAS